MPQAAEPYADTVIVGDHCDTNSLQLGVGQPEQLRDETVYLLFVQTPSGTKSSSPYESNVQLEEDNCPGRASSWCMGLNEGDLPPGPGHDLYVNESHGWRVPGCAIMAETLSNPIHIDNGEHWPGPNGDKCPDHVVY